MKTPVIEVRKVKLEGDLLTVRRTNGDSARPTTFDTTHDQGLLIVWKRAKK